MRRACVAGIGAAALVCLGVLQACSSSDGTRATTTTSVAVPRAPQWTAKQADACRLLGEGDVKAIMSADRVDRRKGTGPGTCAYTLGDARTVTVDLFPPITAAARSARIAGTIPGPVVDSAELRLDSQGRGVYVWKGAAMALVAVRREGEAVEVASSTMTELAGRVAERLPAMKSAATSTDACALVPPAKVFPGATGGDPRDARTCAYRFTDGTLFFLTVDPTRTGAAKPLTQPWKALGSGASVDVVENEGSGGTVSGVVPLRAGAIEVSLSSPARPVSELSAVAVRAAKAVRAALD